MFLLLMLTKDGRITSLGGTAANELVSMGTLLLMSKAVLAWDLFKVLPVRKYLPQP